MDKITYTTQEGLKVSGYFSKGTKEEGVLILHSFGSNKEGTSKILLEELSKKGYGGLAIDFDDVGESELPFEKATPTLYLSEALAGVEFLKEKGFTETSIIGSSFGGFVSLIAAWRHPIKRMVLRGPVIDFYDGAKKRTGGKEIDFPFKDKNGKVRIVTKKCIVDAKRYPMFDHISSMKTKIRIVHGTKDDSVPLSSSIKAAKDNMNVELKILENADHHLRIDGNYEEGNKLVLEFFE